MDQKPYIQYLSLVASGIAALAFFACDSGSGETTTGVGGSGTTGSASTGTTGSTTAATTTSGSQSGSQSSTGSGNPGSSDPIDDMKAQSGSILSTGGRQGAWYTYNDGSAGGTQQPISSNTMPFVKAAVTDAPAGVPSLFAAETYGSGFKTWGAGMGFDLNNVGGAKGAYDGSKYTGITFWAKSGPKGDATGQTVRFSILDVNTAPEGKKCDAASTTTNQCNDAFGTGITLTSSWQQFSFKWSQLAQEGWGKNPGVTALAGNALYSVHFQVSASAVFDIWVTDIAFLE